MVVAACVPQTPNLRVTLREEEFACANAIENLLLSLTCNDLSSLITTGDLPESIGVHELVGIRPGEGCVIAVIDVRYANADRRLPERLVPEPDSCMTWRAR